MEWEKLISQETIRPREKPASVWESYPINNFEKDYREVITSEIFRNLQNKTQVFSLLDSGIARTRLTHSLEVSSVAKQLGTMICNNNRVKKKDQKAEEDISKYLQDISTVLACAGLLHDLGNPAFGHFGEASFGNYFKKIFTDGSLLYKGKNISDYFSEQMKTDFIRFDGNAQTIHILLNGAKDAGRWSINVSYSVINTLIKYPGSSTEVDKKDPDIRRHKFGYYKADEKIYKTIRESVGVSGISRYPLTYLLEAADDISYLLSDMQDSIAMGVMSPWIVLNEFEQMLSEMDERGSESHELMYMAAGRHINNLKNILEGSKNNDELMSRMDVWINSVRDWLIYAAAHSWFENYEAIMNGTFTGELLNGSWHDYIIRMIRTLMNRHVYPSKIVIEQEIGGHKLIENLLSRFVPAVMYYGTEDDSYKPNPVDQRFLWYIPDYLKDEYMKKRTGDEGFDLYLRLLLTIDYISSLTDYEVKRIGEIM